MPDYINLTYSGIIWTDYISQLNKIIEAVNYSSDSYWGDPERFKFMAMIDQFTNINELSNDDGRIVRANLVEKNLVPEVGDIVLYNNDFFEFNSIVENQFFAGKNPDYSMNEDTDGFGVSLSIICKGSKSRVEQLKTIPFKSGIYPTTTKVESTNSNPRTQLYS